MMDDGKSRLRSNTDACRRFAFMMNVEAESRSHIFSFIEQWNGCWSSQMNKITLVTYKLQTNY